MKYLLMFMSQALRVVCTGGPTMSVKHQKAGMGTPAGPAFLIYWYPGVLQGLNWFALGSNKWPKKIFAGFRKCVAVLSSSLQRLAGHQEVC